MLNVLTTKQIDNNNNKNAKRHKEISGGSKWTKHRFSDGYNDGFSQVCAYVQTHQTVYINYVQFFLYELYLNKALNDKKTSHYYWLKLNHIYLLWLS